MSFYSVHIYSYSQHIILQLYSVHFESNGTEWNIFYIIIIIIILLYIYSDLPVIVHVWHQLHLWKLFKIYK